MRPLLITLTVALACLAFGGCKQDESDKERTYDIKGKVVSVDLPKKSVKLDHEDIPGVMRGMEMSFEVDNAKTLEDLKVGDQVQGKLKVKSGARLITELRKQ
jgi:Cu/Ag efflux protein CusF